MQADPLVIKNHVIEWNHQQAKKAKDPRDAERYLDNIRKLENAE